jgi:hypothetical protein
VLKLPFEEVLPGLCDLGLEMFFALPQLVEFDDPSLYVQ